MPVRETLGGRVMTRAELEAAIGDVAAIVRGLSRQRRKPESEVTQAIDRLLSRLGDALRASQEARTSVPTAGGAWDSLPTTKAARRPVSARTAKPGEARCYCGKAARYEVAGALVCDACFVPTHERPGRPPETEASAASLAAHGEKWTKGDKKAARWRFENRDAGPLAAGPVTVEAVRMGADTPRSNPGPSEDELRPPAQVAA